MTEVARKQNILLNYPPFVKWFSTPSPPLDLAYTFVVARFRRLNSVSVETQFMY
jgi:hypothetical protein